MFIDSEVAADCRIVHTGNDIIHLRRDAGAALSTRETCIRICNCLSLEGVRREGVALWLIVLREVEWETEAFRHVVLSEAVVLFPYRKVSILAERKVLVLNYKGRVRFCKRLDIHIRFVRQTMHCSMIVRLQMLLVSMSGDF